MHLEVRLFAYLREIIPESSGGKVLTIELPEGSCVKDLVTYLGLDKLDISLIVLVNGIREFDHSLLKDRDRVGIFPPIGGG